MSTTLTPSIRPQPTRRLSPWRVLLALLIVTGLGAGAYAGHSWYADTQPGGSKVAWFAPYIDVTATPAYAFEQLGATQHKDALLSFVVSLASDPCTPSWGGAYSLDRASEKLDLDRRIARLRQQGGNIAVSFGGALNDELAVKCTDQAKLVSTYRSVVTRYQLDTIDLDLEKAGLTDTAAGERRAAALAELQTSLRAQHKSLAIWLTLPVAPTGLTEDDTTAVALLLKHHVDLAGINVMTMEYGASRTANQSMLAAAKSALTQTQRQLSILYGQAGTELSSNTVWSKIGATPMIGQGSVPSEVFGLDDATGLNDFARARGMGRLSMWSGNRDIQCGSNYVDTKVVSDSCSGIMQHAGAFAELLGTGLSGTMTQNAALITKPETVTSRDQQTDDPASSPYQIWSADGAYLEGTKVVWHHNVYQAKWWNQHDTPDNPVLQSWQTPWELIGPVMPGETPIKQATLPAGKYPDWTGDANYDKGARVMFEGNPYQAKWWNHGESPAAASTRQDSSPWIPLTQAQINTIIGQ